MNQTTLSRRQFLKGAGALVVGFSMVNSVRPRIAFAAYGELPDHLAQTPELDAWLQVNTDGTVTIFSGKVELGQGNGTAFCQVVADELSLSFDQVSIIQGDTLLTPDEGTTSSSASMEDGASALHQASAEARAVLLDLAADRLDAPAQNLNVRNGVISAKGSRKTVSYSELLGGKEFNQKATGAADPKVPAQSHLIGRSLPRIDIPAKVTGGAAYVQHLKLPGMLHGRVVRPPNYGARLQSVDEQAIRDMPGVVTVVRDGSFLGVIAEREEQAIQAADRLRDVAHWSTASLPTTSKDIQRYIRNIPTNDESIEDKGNVERALDRAAETRTATYTRPYQAHASMGPSCAVAQFEGDHLRVWTHSQGVYPLRRELSKLLGLPEDRLRLTHMEGAGCYGHNGADDVGADAALLARAASGRPVRVQWMRQDEFGWEPFGSAMAIDLRGGVNEAGNIVGWEYDVWSDSHSTRPGGGGAVIAAWHAADPHPLTDRGYLAGAYRNGTPSYTFPNKHLKAHYFEGPLRVSAMRALGAYANGFAVESFMDELAEAAGADPLAFRLRHLRDLRARAVLQAATDRAGWQRRVRRDGRGQGIGFAQYKNQATYCAVVADVEVDRASGQIRVHHATAAADAGRIISRDGLRNQIAGGIIQSTSWTLKEEVTFDKTGITSRDWAGYPILRMPEAPKVEVSLIDRPNDPWVGAGEASQGPAAAAIANAVYDAVGVRLRDIPFTPDKVKAALA